MTKLSLNGGKLQIPQNPPEVTYQPWNQVTLVKTFTGELSFQIKDILALLKSQLDPTGRGFNKDTEGEKLFVVQLRLFSVKVWNLTGKVISLSVDDYLDTAAAKGGREQLCGIVDTGHNGSIPAAGYLLPSSHRQHVTRVDDKEKDTYLFHSQVGTSDNGMAYIHLAYRFDGPVHPPLFILPIESIIRQQDYQIEEAQKGNSKLRDLHKVLKGLKSLGDKLEAKSPSVINQIIDGVETAALLVSVVAGEADATSVASDFSDLGITGGPQCSRVDTVTELTTYSAI